MNKYKVKLELYSRLKENTDKINKLREKQAELADLVQKQRFQPIMEDAECIKDCLKSICESQEKINNTKISTLVKFQEEAKKMHNDQNVLILPQKNHKDLQEIIHSKTEIENLITTLQDSKNEEISEFTLQHTVNISNVKNQQLAKDMQAFRNMEGLYNNIMTLKKEMGDFDKSNSTVDQSLNDSDLGCYPYENSSTSSNSIRVSTPLPNTTQSFSILRKN